MSTSTNRGAPRAPKITPEGVRAAQEADRAKAKAKREAKAAAKLAEKQARADEEAARAALHAASHADQDHANALATAKADAEATGVSLETMLAEMGIDAEGKPLVPLDDPRPEQATLGYVGPMLALKSARVHYVKGTNGQPHCNDPIGQFFQAFKREDVVEVCMKALGHTRNKYASLNPGQQSMNYRNSVRGAMKRGELTMEALRAANQAA